MTDVRVFAALAWMACAAACGSSNSTNNDDLGGGGDVDLATPSSDPDLAMNTADLAGTNLDLTSAPDLTPADDLGPAVDLVGADLSDFPSINITNVTSDESNAGTKAFTFTLTLSPASTAPVTVAWTTVDNTATAPADYTAASGVVTFAPGGDDADHHRAGRP
jgi:hypothetical protein